MYWSDGLNNYKQHKIAHKKHYIDYKLLINGDVPNYSFDEIVLRNLEGNQLPIHLLYSGGIDSEFVLVMLKKLNVQFDVVTMKLTYKNLIINTQDIYYSDKFCRHNNIKQKTVTLDCKTFYESGDYQKFLIPYEINSAYLASQFWLLSQLDGFNIIGGNYFWPHFEKKNPVLSPMTYGSNFHQKFMTDNNIRGIGNMLSHSYGINYLLIKEHKKFVDKEQKINAKEIKGKVYKNLSQSHLELRNISHGWENKDIFNVTNFNLPNNLYKHCQIVWDENIRNLLETNLYENHLR
jgi:hypothetical protein